MPEFAVARLGTSLFRTPGPIYSTAISRDGTLLAAGTTSASGQFPSQDIAIVVFDAKTGATRHRFNGYGHVVRGLSFSPDNRSLAAAHGDGSVSLHDLTTGQEVWRLKDVNSDCVLILPDGQSVAMQRGTSVVLVKIMDGTITQTLRSPERRIHAIAATDKGDRLAAAADSGFVFVWDLTSGVQTHRFLVKEKYALGLAFSPDGRRLAAAGFNNDYTVWDLTTKKLLWSMNPDPDGVGGPLVFSTDGQELLGLRRGGGVFDANTGAIKRRLDDLPSHHIAGVSGDRTLYAPVFSDHEARLVDIASGKQRNVVPGHRRPPAAAVFADGGPVVYTACEEEPIRRWDARTGKFDRAIKRTVISLIASPGGERIATLDKDGNIGILNVHSDEWTSFKKGAVFMGPGAIAPAGRDGWLYDELYQLEYFRWDGHASELKPCVTGRHFRLETSRPEDVRFATSPDGKQIIYTLARKDSPVVWWDAVTGKVIRSQPSTIPLAPRFFLPNGEYVLAESPAGITLIRADTGEIVRLVCPRDRLSLDRPLKAIAVSPDGRLLAAGRDHGIQLVEIATGEVRRVFQPGETLSSLAFSPDGSRLVSTGAGCAGLVWDVFAPASGHNASSLEKLSSVLENGTGQEAHDAICRLRQKPELVLSMARAIVPSKRENTDRVLRLLADLDDVSFPVRETAQRELTKFDRDTLPVIEEFLRKPNLSPESIARGERARDSLRRETVGSKLKRQLRVVELLEAVDTPEARAELGRLGRGDPGIRLTTEAGESLKRLESRPVPVPAAKSK
ncbi:High-affnity carbon uptake protein Hat/HatR [Fimbriiglobus ruber]|uniref:High-affnity carbon uptake protein Hat/HatR n=1 Tax=Fimbriiglobus ruber TaxID=1908690 RepID=A0A225CZ32_9BACT|nr:High-affnity carbon uptake protein Hat/HatR [Fimbriiglobus ruber]